MTLTTYNTVTLAVDTPMQLLPPVAGHCNYVFLNGTGNLHISNANTVGSNATSITIVADGQLALPVGPGGIWVSSDAAGPISVAVIPNR